MMHRRQRFGMAMVLAAMVASSISACHGSTQPGLKGASLPSASPLAPAQTPAAPILATKKPPPKMSLVAWRTGTVHLTSLTNAVAINGGTAIAIGEPDKDVAFDPSIVKGAEGGCFPSMLCGEVAYIGGTWPTSLWMTSRSQYDRSSSPWSVRRYQSDHWTAVANRAGLLDSFFMGYQPFRDGSTIALQMFDAHDDAYDPDGTKQAAVVDALKKVAPSFHVVDGATSANVPVITAGLSLGAFATTPNGDVVALMPLPDDDAVDSVDHWAAGGTTGKVEKLPLAPGERVGKPGIWAGRGSAFFVGGALEKDGPSTTPYLARFDGAEWQRETLPVTPGWVTSIAQESDGTLWATTAKSDDLFNSALMNPYGPLFRRAPGAEAWEKVALDKVTISTPASNITLGMGIGMWAPLTPETPASTDSFALRAQSVLVGPGDELWVVATPVDDSKADAGGLDGIDNRLGGFPSVVLRARPQANVVTLPAPMVLPLVIADQEPDVLATPPSLKKDAPSCVGYFLALETLPADAPATWTSPALDVALHAQHAPHAQALFIEASTKGHRVVGVYAPADDASAITQKKLVALGASLAKTLPEVSPALYCKMPIATRIIDTSLWP